MNLFPMFQTILYTMSTALLYPVVILLIALSVWLVIYSGGFISEWIRRKHYRSSTLLANYLETIQKEGELPEEIKENLPIHIQKYAKELQEIISGKNMFTEERVEDFIQRKEHSLFREVGKIQLIIRGGPSLGLMGTLIPMGTGLAGLTQGNMAQLSSSLIIAFSTTVVGLALGIIAYVFSMVKERWAIDDMRKIQLITEALMKEVPKVS